MNIIFQSTTYVLLEEKKNIQVLGTSGEIGRISQSSSSINMYH